MDPAAYEWVPDGAPGVFTKWLGTFTERNTRLGLIHIDAGATFSAGQQSSIELLFLSKGTVSLDGRDYGPNTGFEFLAKEGPIPVTAKAASELLCIVLPRF